MCWPKKPICKTPTVILLTGVFWALNLVAEFSHNHIGAETLLAMHSADCDFVGEKNPRQNNFSICIACVHSNTVMVAFGYVAQPGLNALDHDQLFKPTAEDSYRTAILFSVVSRAPPSTAS